MWFRLAAKLGGRTVDELQRAMSSEEFGYWIAFYKLEPFGDRIEDIRAGTIAASVINPQLRKDATPYAPLDFFSWAAEQEKPKTPPSAEALASSIFGINLAEIKQSGNKRLILRREPGGTYKSV